MTPPRNSDDIEEETDESRVRKITIPLSMDATIPITAKLLKKQKDIKEADKELVIRRQEHATRLRKADKRKDDLDKRERLLVKSLKDFEEFIEERERKKRESAVRYQEEYKLVAKLDQQLLGLHGELKKLTHKNEILKRYVIKYQPTYDFLKTVAEESVIFEDVEDIISFYDTLMVVNKELTQAEETNLKAIGGESEKLLAFETEKQNEVLALSNRLCGLRLKRKATADQVLAVEARFNDIQWSSNKRTMAFGQIAMAITSMYMTICAFEKTSSGERNPLKQMEKVQEFIQDWSDVVPEAKRIYELETV